MRKPSRFHARKPIKSAKRLFQPYQRSSNDMQRALHYSKLLNESDLAEEVFRCLGLTCDRHQRSESRSGHFLTPVLALWNPLRRMGNSRWRFLSSTHQALVCLLWARIMMYDLYTSRRGYSRRTQVSSPQVITAPCRRPPRDGFAILRRLVDGNHRHYSGLLLLLFAAC
jgi:hypothetical protein